VFTKHNLLIAIDQEGGLVQRLKRKYGFFGRFPRASTVAKKGKNYASVFMKKWARGVKKVLGINFQF